MSSSYGKNLRITVFGQSHSPAIGVTMEGLPAGKTINMEELGRFLARRAPGGGKVFSTARTEPDLPEFLCGVKDGVTCGAPLTAIIRNTNQRSGDYAPFADTPRPGHADYTAAVKYFGAQDAAGGGHFSGRLTAPICIAGGICLQLLREQGITVACRIASIGKIRDEAPFTGSVDAKDFPAVTDSAGEAMLAEIAACRSRGDSVGGVIECRVDGLPVGLGDPMFDGMENRIASVVFGIPAVKGLEFGAGFAVSEMYGSENNDPFRMSEGRVITETNHAGGILGGITNGMPLTFRCAFKPTPSISLEQRSVNLRTGENAALSVGGRHDPCVVVRAVPVVEAAAALAVYDAFLEYSMYRR